MVEVLFEEALLRRKLLDFGRGMVLDCGISFQPWDKVLAAETLWFAFEKGWVKVLEVPPYLWMVEVIKNLVILYVEFDGVVVGEWVYFKACDNVNWLYYERY